MTAGFPADKIVVKNNAIDLGMSGSFQHGDRKRSGIAYVSRISVSKGADTLKGIIGAIHREIHVVGDGPDLPALRDYCARFGHTHVTFWGRQTRERCFEIMASAECTVIPSQCGESFSLVAAESMSLGTPVVGSNVGGLGPLLRDSGGGLAVAPENTQGFVDAIVRLGDDPELARRIGLAGKKYAEERLNASVNTRELLSIYDDVLRARRSRQAAAATAG